MSETVEIDPPDDDMETLAAEYVLGLLTVAQLPHVVALRQGSERFDQAVNRWELRLLPFAEELQNVQPPAKVWAAIATAIKPAPAASGIWDNVRFWRKLSLGIGAFAAGLAAELIFIHPHHAPQPLAVATLASQHDGIFVATAQQSNDGIQLLVSPAQVVVPAGKSAELWLITPGNKPAPLGLLGSDRPVTVIIPASQLGGNIALAELAVSLEPPGGSPTGQPTGEIISAAKFSPL